MGKTIRNGLLAIIILVSFQNTTAQWIQLQGLAGEEVRSLAVIGENVFAGTPTNGLFVSANNGFTWVKNENGLPNQYIRALVSEGNTIYVCCNGILCSTNNGLTWNSILSGKDVTCLYVNGNELIANVFDTRIILSSLFYENFLIASSDRGHTWNTTMASPTRSQYGLVRKIDKLESNIVVGTTDGVSKYASNGIDVSWIFNYRVETFLTLGNYLIVGNWGKGIFISSDYGSTWSNENNGLFDTDISSLFCSDSLIFAGTHNGNIFVSNDIGKKWSSIGSILKNSILSFGINDSYLFVGTDSSGVWRRPLSEMLSKRKFPTEFSLSQNYPSPFNPSTNIRFELPQNSFVTLKVYNILGEEVATLINKNESAGIHDVNFDASRLTSGVYIYTIKAGGFVQSKKMLLLK